MDDQHQLDELKEDKILDEVEKVLDEFYNQWTRTIIKTKLIKIKSIYFPNISSRTNLRPRVKRFDLTMKTS